MPKFKSDQTGWLHHLSFYTPFTQAREITVKDRTIVTGHPVLIEFPYQNLLDQAFSVEKSLLSWFYIISVILHQYYSNNKVIVYIWTDSP